MNMRIILILLQHNINGGIISELQIKQPYYEFEKIKMNNSTSSDEENDDYIWEKSGLFEGDIAFWDHEKNVLLNNSYRWPNATIVFYIEEKHFKDEEILIIFDAIREFHLKTCLNFKPYEENDDNWVVITGNEEGCWSSVGMKREGGQQLNLKSPNCVRKGVVIHEFLHAAGFYHQQSATNRDEYVEILWENIKHEHLDNFKKYNESIITDYGIEYDYESIMHYSSKAFSKNGNDTIRAKNNVKQLGQREGFSKKDILKLNLMYEKSCQFSRRKVEDTGERNLEDWIKFLFNKKSSK